MVFALPTMQQLYSLEVSIVSSLVLSGIGTVGLDLLLFFKEINIIALMDLIVKEGNVLFLQVPYKEKLNHVPKGWEKDNRTVQYAIYVPDYYNT